MELNINKEEPIFPIRTAAKLLDISVHTLRMYEKEGLIIPFKKDTNQRLYSQKDIERIECVRKAIRDQKISINGIKMIFSLLPCWEIMGCSKTDRENCKAYEGHHEPCWTYNHPNTTCANRDCRECEVYKNLSNCTEIKEKLKELIKGRQ